MANKFLDGSGLSYLWSKIKAKFVAKEDGKGLSTNDYTTAEKTKLAGIDPGATAVQVENTLDSTSASNALSAAQGKALNEKIDAIDGIIIKMEVDENGAVMSARTANSAVCDENGKTIISTYATKDELGNYATKTDISAVYKYKGSVDTYATLPTENLTVGDVYNVKAANKANGIKAGDNVAWDGTAWDVLSGTVDLSGYMQTSDMTAITNAEIDTIIAS